MKGIKRFLEAVFNILFVLIIFAITFVGTALATGGVLLLALRFWGAGI